MFGGSAEGALKRIAEIANGWVGGSGDNDFYLRRSQKVKDYVQTSGKDPESLGSGRLACVLIDQDR